MDREKQLVSVLCLMKKYSWKHKEMCSILIYFSMRRWISETCTLCKWKILSAMKTKEDWDGQVNWWTHANKCVWETLATKLISSNRSSWNMVVQGGCVPPTETSTHCYLRAVARDPFLRTGSVPGSGWGTHPSGTSVQGGAGSTTQFPVDLLP